MLKSKAWMIFTWVFFTLSAVNIIALNIPVEQGVFTSQNYLFNVLTKPLIMASALYYLMKYLTHQEFYNWLLVAFLYSLLGDVLLMGQGINELFFVGGLGAFCIAQGAYIVYFYRSAGSWYGPNRSIRILQGVVVLFSIGLYSLMLPNLGVLWIPVLLYLTIIASMGIVALGRLGRVNFNTFTYTTIGAFSFILSGSIIGYNKFVDEIPFAGSLIMVFYCFAQYMILKGFIALQAQESPEPLRT
jgi:uncharacterized membrane protein YhhN